MTTQEVLTLLNAGYTKQEIMSMDIADNAASPDPASATDPAPDPAPATDPAPAPAPDPSQFAGMLQTMFTQFGDRMQSIMQKMNLQSTEQPVPESAQDVIASIINPPGRDRK